MKFSLVGWASFEFLYLNKLFRVILRINFIIQDFLVFSCCSYFILESEEKIQVIFYSGSPCSSVQLG
jgi:hypothetical protein